MRETDGERHAAKGPGQTRTVALWFMVGALLHFHLGCFHLNWTWSKHWPEITLNTRWCYTNNNFTLSFLSFCCHQGKFSVQLKLSLFFEHGWTSWQEKQRSNVCQSGNSMTDFLCVWHPLLLIVFSCLIVYHFPLFPCNSQSDIRVETDNFSPAFSSDVIVPSLWQKQPDRQPVRQMTSRANIKKGTNSEMRLINGCFISNQDLKTKLIQNAI